MLQQQGVKSTHFSVHMNVLSAVSALYYHIQYNIPIQFQHRLPSDPTDGDTSDSLSRSFSRFPFLPFFQAQL